MGNRSEFSDSSSSVFMNTSVPMGENVDEHQKFIAATKLARFHIQVLLSLHRKASFFPRFWIKSLVNAICTVVVSKSVHDPVYGHVLDEEMKKLSRGKTAEKALAVALAGMLSLVGTVVPDTINRIPCEFLGYEMEAIAAIIGYGCSILTEPLSSFVFGITSSSGFTPMNLNVDIESQRPMENPSLSRRFSVEANLAIAAIGGTAVAGLLASGKEDSPYLRVFTLASGIGFSGGFLAAHTANKPKLSKFLSKAGAIGVASAITVALGNAIDTIMLFGYINVNVTAISIICLVHAAFVIFGT